MPNCNEITRRFGLQTLLLVNKVSGILENRHTDGAAGRTLRVILSLPEGEGRNCRSDKRSAIRQSSAGFT
ncbi:MAG: hypothetical protein ABW157_08675 [Candidatus Thiodiazotropha sp. LLP2]